MFQLQPLRRLILSTLIATMEHLVRLVFLGQSGAGKSRLINILKENDSQKDGVPTEGINSEAERIYGCRYLHTRIEYNGEKYNLRIVDTPGFFQEGVTKATKNWRDMAEAVHKSGMAVNVFVIVLEASDVINSKKVLQSFVVSSSKTTFTNPRVKPCQLHISI